MAPGILKVFMGNTSSAPSAREQHRLSKPKTNTNGSFSSPKLDTCDSPTSPTKGSDVTEEEVVVRTSSGEYRSRQDARQHIRSQLFGSSDSITTLHSGESNDSLRDLASHVKDRLQSLSRSGSIVSQLPSAQTSSTKLNGAYGDSRLSLVPETQSIDIETAITILQELRKTASPEDLVALHKALLPTRRAEPSPTKVSALPKGPSTDCVSSLIRRRSLAAPGLATRTQDLLRKPERPVELEIQHVNSHVWQANMLESSPLASLAKLNLRDEEGRGTMPRPETPADMDYTHLGGFKLGSLKITNGMASPAPSMTASKNVSRRQSTPDLQHREDDYFTASEGCASLERITPGNTWQTELASQTSILPRAPVSRKVRARQEALRTKASGSPLRIERRRDNSDDIIRNDRSLSSDSVVRHTGHCSALNLAENYMAELPASPYSNQTSLREDLAHDDASDIDSTTAALRTDALCKLNGTSGEGNTAPLWQDSDFKLPPLTDFTHNNTLKIERPPHVKADSGYSSGNNLTTLQTKWNVEDDASIYSKRASHYDILQTTGSDDTRSIHASQQAPSSSASSHRSVEASRSITEEPADPHEEEKARPSKTRRKSIIRSISLGRVKHRSLPATPTTSDLPPVPSSQSSEQSPRKCKKLQKQRPNAQVSPVVQGQRPIRAGSIPYVPDDVVAKFCKRIQSSPDMEHLKRTYASVKAGSNESFEEPIPASVPIVFPGDSVRNSLALDVDDEKLPPLPPPHRQAPPPPSHCRSDSRSRSNYSGHRSEDYAFLGVSDFGTVAQSLGGSPYDIAMGTLKGSSPATPTQPHHLGTKVSAQSSSKTAMDSETAAAYARARSHDRAAPPERNARSTSRPRSFHERDLKDGERYMKNFSRPHSMYDDAPPVPALPSSRGSANSASSTQNVAELPASPVKARAELPAGDVPPIVTPAPASAPAPAPAAESETPSQRPSTGIDWESHRNLWRQRRKSIGEGLLRRSTEPTTDSDRALIAPKAAAPAIVISRYFTPIQHPSPSAVPTATSPPLKRSASPSIAALAARFEQQQQQQQNSETAPRSPTKSAMELSVPTGRHSADSARSSRSSRSSPYVQSTASASASAEDVRDSLTDRYSGGLGYGYEAGFGLGGSAGTRHLRSAASRKSLGFAHQFGVDLSDVPVFVTKAG